MWTLTWQLAGQVGVDPSPFTFWELAQMAEGQSRDRWTHTATAVWVVAEVNRNKKKRSRPFTPANFNPYERKAAGGGKRLTVGTLLAMRAAFEQGAKA